MSALTMLLRRQAEQNPSASYFNVDILKYQIKCKEGAGSCPFQLVAYWKCETTHTDLKVSSHLYHLIKRYSRDIKATISSFYLARCNGDRY